MPLQLSNASRLQITARGPVASHVHWLDKGATTLVGAGESCGLRLRHASVAALHCLLRSDDNGFLWVQPWSETAAVLVDGEPLAEEREVSPAQEIQVGEFRLSIRAAAESHTQGTATTHTPGAAISGAVAAAPPDVECGAESHTPGAARSGAVAVAPPDVECGGECGELSKDAAPLTAGWEAVDPSWWDCDWESQELDQPLDSPRKEGARPPIRGSAARDSDAALDLDADGLQVRIRSLEAEVAQLQGDLMQRESELTAALPPFGASLENAAPLPGGAAPEDSQSAADVVPAARFEGAMAELEQSDERISELESLLRLAEEAQVAEREERQLIEAWVGDLEARAADHDRERAAELELLRKRLQRSQEEVERLGRELTKSHADCREAVEALEVLETRRAAPSSQASQASQAAARDSAAARELQAAQASVAAELREENAALRGHLQAAAAELDESLARLQRIEEESAASDLRSRVDDALRAERLQMAQDRAAVAREKAELARQLGELEHQLQTARQHSGAEIDSRIHAFREHLRSIHDKEPRDSADRQGLGSRLSRLWRRLESGGP